MISAKVIPNHSNRLESCLRITRPMRRGKAPDAFEAERRDDRHVRIDVMKEIKDVEPSVLVIIVTEYGDEEMAVEAFSSGARDYLKKPFSISSSHRAERTSFPGPRPVAAGNTVFRRHPQPAPQDPAGR